MKKLNATTTAHQSVPPRPFCFLCPHSRFQRPLLKMPGKAAHRQKKAAGHLNQHAKDKNDVSVDALIAGDAKKFVARIAANRGPYFQLVFHDGKETSDSMLLGSPCGAFVAGGKRKCKVRIRLSRDDMVVVEGCERYTEAKLRGRPLVVEITGKLTRKEAQDLYRAGRIHPSVYKKPIVGAEDGEDDDLFDYSSEDEEGDSEEEDDRATRTKRGMCATRVKAGGKKATANIKSRQDVAENGGPGGREKKKDVLAEALAATEYAAGAGGPVLEEEEDGEALAEMLGMGREKKSAKSSPASEEDSAPPAASLRDERRVRFAEAVAAPGEWGAALLEAGGGGGGRNQEEDDGWRADVRKGAVPDTWEDELDIDAI